MWLRQMLCGMWLLAATGAVEASSLDPHATEPTTRAHAAPGVFFGLPRALRPSLPLDARPTTPPPLTTRVLDVSADDQIELGPHEVVLTFDDGPSAAYTPSVLKILDAYGVKATFMMIGEMAEMFPQVARDVAIDGQTVGTHTYRHPNLAKLSLAAAFAEIQHGKDAVAAVLAPIGLVPSPFFRFPYLAMNWVLQASVTMDGTIALGVQIDSDDYFHDTPEETLGRLMARLDQTGKGIVLFHDIHAKTLVVLPLFLRALAERGYTVVELRATKPSPFSVPLSIAEQ